MLNKDVEEIRSLISMEKNHASGLLKSVSELNNVVIREILSGIALDSRKHSEFYQAINTLLLTIEPAINEGEFEKIEEVIKKHIDVEKKMMKKSKALLSSFNDKRIIHLVQEIYEDEKKHHIIMKRILDAVVKRETIFEDQWWDFIWEGVPGHGTPIG